MKKTAFLVGGGTGGHFFAAVALGEELQLRGHDVFIITDNRCKRYLESVDKKLSVHVLTVVPLYSKGLAKIKSVFTMAKAFFKTCYLISKYKPNLVVGFGGYTTIPVLSASLMLRVPIMIHEQNCVLGRANLFFARFAKYITAAFPLAGIVNDNIKNRLVVVGNPVRQQFRTNIKRNFSSDVFKILVLGGSQGANFFSSLVPNAIKLLAAHHPNLKIEIVHQAASKDITRLKKIYARLNIEHEVKSFFKDVFSKYKNSHLAISRAGASTISEVISLSQPTIFIPYPYATHNHQLLNAKILEEKKAGWCLEQSSITPNILSEKILELANTRNMLNKVAEELCKMKYKIEGKFVELVEKSMS